MSGLRLRRRVLNPAFGNPAFGCGLFHVNRADTSLATAYRPNPLVVGSVEKRQDKLVKDKEGHCEGCAHSTRNQCLVRIAHSHTILG